MKSESGKFTKSLGSLSENISKNDEIWSKQHSLISDLSEKSSDAASSFSVLTTSLQSLKNSLSETENVANRIKDIEETLSSIDNSGFSEKHTEALKALEEIVAGFTTYTEKIDRLNIEVEKYYNQSTRMLSEVETRLVENLMIVNDRVRNRRS